MSRRRMSVLELIVAGVLLVALLTLCVQFLSAAARQRRALTRRQAAIEEVGSLMQRIAARPWESLTTENLKELQPSDEARTQLPGAELEIDVVAAPDDPAAKRVAVSLCWLTSGGELTQPVRLVAWRYPTEGSKTTQYTARSSSPSSP